MNIKIWSNSFFIERVYICFGYIFILLVILLYGCSSGPSELEKAGFNEYINVNQNEKIYKHKDGNLYLIKRNEWRKAVKLTDCKCVEIEDGSNESSKGSKKLLEELEALKEVIKELKNTKSRSMDIYEGEY